MSYHIYFLKNINLNQDNVHEFLESNILEGQLGYISYDERLKIANQIKSIGIPFIEFNSETKIQLSAESYEVLFFKSMIGIGIPFWKENNEVRIRKEIENISDLILKNGFIIFDPQSDEFRTFAFEATDDFEISYDAVNVENRINKISLFDKIKKWLGISK